MPDYEDPEENLDKRMAMRLVFMFGVPLALLLTAFLLSGCNTLPFFHAVEEVLDDEAIQIMVSKEAVEQRSEITINIEFKPITE